ncbi:hypothetical protein ABPG75_012277 [Micractinium tetrahymenae]
MTIPTFEHEAGPAGRLIVARTLRGSSGRSSLRAAPPAAPLCASIAANAAASQVLRPAPALTALAQDTQHGLLVAAAMARTFLARGSALQLRRRRRKPAAKPVAAAAAVAAPTSTMAAPAMTATAAPTAAAAAAAGTTVAKSGGAATRGLQQFLAGGVAGAVSKTLVAPLERVSTMLMADAKRFSVGQAAAHAWKDGLYRGHAATLIKIFPASAIQFAVFNGLKDRMLAARQQAQQAQHVQQQQQQHGVDARQQRQQGVPATAASAAAPTAASSAASAASAAASTAAAAAAAAPLELENHERLLAGAAAGAAAACACYPLESLRTMMGVAGGVRGNLLQVAHTVVAAHGVGALYKGFRASLIGDILGNSLGFTAYEIGTRLYTSAVGSAPPPHLRGVIGACSAACVVTLTMPLEVVRRRLQVQGLAGRPVLYRGTLDCLRQVLRSEGLGGFYAASLPAYLKVAPSLGMMYFLYEILKPS